MHSGIFNYGILLHDIPWNLYIISLSSHTALVKDILWLYYNVGFYWYFYWHLSPDKARAFSVPYRPKTLLNRYSLIVQWSFPLLPFGKSYTSRIGLLPNINCLDINMQGKRPAMPRTEAWSIPPSGTEIQGMVAKRGWLNSGKYLLSSTEGVPQVLPLVQKARNCLPRRLSQSWSVSSRPGIISLWDRKAEFFTIMLFQFSPSTSCLCRTNTLTNLQHLQKASSLYLEPPLLSQPSWINLSVMEMKWNFFTGTPASFKGGSLTEKKITIT